MINACIAECQKHARRTRNSSTHATVTVRSSFNVHTLIKITGNLITKRLGGEALEMYLVQRIEDFSPHSIAETLPSPHKADIVGFLFDNQLLRTRLWPRLMLLGYVVLCFIGSRMSSAKRNYKSHNLSFNVYI